MASRPKNRLTGHFPDDDDVDDDGDDDDDDNDDGNNNDDDHNDDGTLLIITEFDVYSCFSLSLRVLKATAECKLNTSSCLFLSLSLAFNLYAWPIPFFFYLFFLDASSHLYNRLCPSVCWSVTHSLKTSKS